MGEKLRIGLLFGGRSAEHEISLRSARSVAAALDGERFELYPVGIDRAGRWFLTEHGEIPLGAEFVGTAGLEVLACAAGTRCELRCRSEDRTVTIDVVFPVLHGPYGEDGTLQGMLELIGVPYVGAGVLGSAIAMDKDVHKRLLRDAGLPIVPFATLTRTEWIADRRAVLKRVGDLRLPLFVKPANLGSSIGINKVVALSGLEPAIEEALRYDNKVVVELGIDAREIETAVLGNDEPRCSVPGEIVPGADFYSFDDKYDAASSAELLIPAPLSEQECDRIRATAIEVFRVLELAGMARIDFFVDRGDGSIYVNEPNTIPGFTSISMYAKLWEATGLPYAELISALIDLAVERRRARPD